MATTYSVQYNNLYILKPAVKTTRQRVMSYKLEFEYTQVLAGTAGDIVYLQQLPPFSRLYLASSVIYMAGFTAGMTLSVGFGAYTDKSGVLQSASATGLLNALPIGAGTGMWNAGMLSIATPDDFVPVVGAIMKDFENMTPVDIFATFNAQVPGANAVLNGYFEVANIG